MNIWDAVLIVAVALAVGAAVRRLMKNRKQGKCTCGCDCAACGRGCDGKKRA